MNARVLELIKMPNLITENDLGILEKEIVKHPFLQSLRALHLLGLHQFQKEDYASQLTVTAAFTTDKKILYTFINQQAKQTVEGKTEATPVVSPLTPTSELPTKEIVENQFVEDEEVQEKAILVNNEEAEKEVMNEEVERIAEPEIAVENVVEETIVHDSEIQNTEMATEVVEMTTEVEFNNEIVEEIVEEPQSELSPNLEMENEEQNTIDKVDSDDKSEKLQTNVEIMENKETDTAINFHGVDDFLPQVKMPKQTEDYISMSQQQLTRKVQKQQDEMQRLIAEVEAKMKAKKLEQNVEVKEEVEETPQNFEINFSEVHDVYLERQEIKTSEIQQEIAVESPAETSEEWTPMEPTLHTGSSRFSKQNTALETLDNSFENNEDESQVVEDVERIEETTEETTEVEATEPQQESSNVPQFINTLHSWLNLNKEKSSIIALEAEMEIEDEAEEVAVTEIEEEAGESTLVNNEDVKTKAIDDFIENEPKISKLKESTEFIYKDRGDDISHLMTDTLVGLYIEQRLYTKAIQGYEILIEKYPEKKHDYLMKIEAVKNLKLNPKGGD